MKNHIIVATAGIFLLTNSLAFAAKDEKKSEDFVAHKAEVLAKINAEKSVIDENAKCVEAATTKAAIKDCNKAAKEKKKELKEKNKKEKTK